MFTKVRQGNIRVIFGSTAKMGSGTNIQDRLIHLHDLDCPWRPSDLEQRLGRIARQGNMNPEVGVTRYVTDGTFDSYLYQTVEVKQKFISQIMSSKNPVRSCEDIDETALSFAEIKALCAGNPLIREKMDLDIEVARLRLLKADYQSQHYRLEDNLLTNFPKAVEKDKSYMAGFKKDIEHIKSQTQPNDEGFSPMKIGEITYRDKEQAGNALLEACKKVTGTESLTVGSYRGLEIRLSFDSFSKTFTANLKGEMSYEVELSSNIYGNITRMNNAISDLPNRLTSVERHLENLYIQTENAKTELQKPFQFEDELNEKSTRLTLLDAELNMDSNNQEEKTEQAEQQSDETKEAEPRITQASRITLVSEEKPSILDSLKTSAESKITSDKSNSIEISI